MKTIQFPVDETHSPILIYDQHSLEIIEANPASLTLYGYDKEEMLSLTIKDLVPEKELPELERYEREEEKGLKHTSVWRNQKKDGSIIYVRIQANFVNYEGRECRLAIIHDVTEKIHSQRKYQIEHELLESLLNKLPGMYLLLDADHEIRRWNHTLVNLTGYSEEEIENMSMLDFIDESGHDEVEKAIEKTKDGEDAALETILETKNNNQTPVFINLTRIDVNQNSYIQAVGLDISHLKEVERELRQANKEKETMLSEIHHRVKNNLAVISSMIELQAMDDDSPQVRDKLDNAKLRIKSIALIHELLYQSESFTNVDFAENLKRLVDMISRTLESEADVSIDYQVEPVILSVNQALPLANIANELVTNAYKHAFNDQNKGSIILELFESDDEVHLNVIDDGQGMPEDFDMFNTQSLGFSIINSLIDQLDAELDIKNDDGARFELTMTRVHQAKGSASNVSEGEMSNF